MNDEETAMEKEQTRDREREKYTHTNHNRIHRQFSYTMHEATSRLSHESHLCQQILASHPTLILASFHPPCHRLQHVPLVFHCTLHSDSASQVRRRRVCSFAVAAVGGHLLVAQHLPHILLAQLQEVLPLTHLH